MLLGLTIVSCEDPAEHESSNGPRDLDSLLALYPDSVPLLVERGNELFLAYEYDRAMNDAAKAFRLDSNNLEARLLYAEVLNNREHRTVDEVATAQRMYKVVVKKEPKNLRALVGLAATYAFMQDFEKTFQYVNEALRIDPKYRDAYVLKGSTYRQLGNMKLAISSYETAIQQDPDFFEAYFLLGQIYQAENNPTCVEYFATALELRPDILEVKYQLAYSKELHGQVEGAKELYREMAQDTVDYYVSHGLFHLGHIKQFKENEIDSAMYYYKSAIETEPRFVEAWHNLGLCHAVKGDKSKALKSFSNALKYDPNFELSRQEAERLR
jgi:tetratricopeptide (TPR) repeat protein